MADIKTKDVVLAGRAAEKAVDTVQRMERVLTRSRETLQDQTDTEEASPASYAEGKLKRTAEDTLGEVGFRVKEKVEKDLAQGRNAFREYRQEIRAEKNAKKEAEAVKRYDPDLTPSALQTRGDAAGKIGPEVVSSQRTEMPVKTRERPKHSIKEKGSVFGGSSGKTVKPSSRRSIKTAEASAKVAETGKAGVKVAGKTAKTARPLLKRAATAVVSLAKNLAAGIQSLTAILSVGGMLAVITMTILCVLAMVLGSSYGIFFANEDTGSGQTLGEVIREIDEEYRAKIDQILKAHPHDTMEILDSGVPWPEVLAVYAIVVNADPENGEEVVAFTEEKKQRLKEVFWDMTGIVCWKTEETQSRIVEEIDEKGNLIETTFTEVVHKLWIEVNHLTAEEMAVVYGFDGTRNAQLMELLLPENKGLWEELLQDM